MSPVRILQLRDDAALARWAAPIADLEAGVRYPLGHDRFELDHGPDYFAFFRRLGEIVAHIAVDEEDRVVALAQSVLRTLPGVGPAWYICDLKVRPAWRRRRLPWRLFQGGFLQGYLRCGRGYGISMNPPQGENPVVRLARRFHLPNQVAATLLLYSLDHAQMEQIEPALRAARGPLSYLSLGGIKDIVLESTGAPMPLLHVQHGPLAESGGAAPQPGHVHMFCVPEGDPLVAACAALGWAPSASASVIQHRMRGMDWGCLLTSGI